ncbi:MAG: hypothetical protein DRP75_00375 [Candidatus Omnitrophota bacterium]|nr:MAG: hypothetical protein DRP75_00375 [Candidatus Omnitrophota bacterium]
MKIEIKQTGPCKRKIKISVPIERLNQKIETLFSHLARTTALPGFRKGRVPWNILKTRYGEEIREKAIEKVISEASKEALQKSNLTPIGPLAISQIETTNDYLHFQMTLEIYPQIRLGRYKEIKLVRKQKRVSEKDVEKEIENLRALLKSAQAQKSNDKEKELPVGDEFAQLLGKPSLKELKEAVRSDLIKIEQEKANKRLEADLLKQIIKSSKVDIPPSLMQMQKERILKEIENYLTAKGLTKEEREAEIRKIEKSAERNAIEQIKSSFLLAEIGKREGIEVSKEEIEERIEEIASFRKEEVKKIKEEINRKGLYERLKEEVRRRKTIEFILESAEVKDEYFDSNGN